MQLESGSYSLTLVRPELDSPFCVCSTAAALGVHPEIVLAQICRKAGNTKEKRSLKENTTTVSI